MASLGNNVKTALLKGLEALGKGASSMASNAHQKLNEINLETRRHELMSEVPICALELWQKGVELPEPLSAMLKELSDLDEQLTVLRAQRYASVEANGSEASEESGDAEAQEALEETGDLETREEALEQAETLNPECAADGCAVADAAADSQNTPQQAPDEADAAIESDERHEQPADACETGDNA